MTATRWVISTLLCITVSGCGQVQTAPLPPSNPAIHILIDQPSPSRELTNSTVTVLVTDSTNKPIDNAKVVLTSSMPGMSMPLTPVDCKEIKPGDYTGTTVFTMKGNWQIDADATLPDGTHAHTNRIVQVQ